MDIVRATDCKTLEKIRIDRDFKTRSSLADSMGVNRNTVSRILDGKIQPSADVMYAFVVALSIPPSEAGEIFFGYALRNM